MKKFTAMIALLLAAALLLCACGKTEQEKVQETNAALQEAPAETEAGETAAGAVEVTDADFRTEALDDTTCQLTLCAAETTGTLVVPEVIDGRTVVEISSAAFLECQASKIVLPDTVTYIGENTFNLCENLKTVEVGTGLKDIGMMAFNFCPKLESVSFPEGMESFGSCVFLGCNALEEVYIPDTVTVFNGVIANAATCPDLVIVTPAGSAAQAQAELDGIPVRNP